MGARGSWRAPSRRSGRLGSEAAVTLRHDRWLALAREIRRSARQCGVAGWPSVPRSKERSALRWRYSRCVGNAVRPGGRSDGWCAIGSRNAQGRRQGLFRFVTFWRLACPGDAERASMVFMLLQVGSWPSGRGPATAMPGTSPRRGGGNPVLTLILALFMVGYVPSTGSSPVADPGCASACRGLAGWAAGPARARPPAGGQLQGRHGGNHGYVLVVMPVTSSWPIRLVVSAGASARC